MKTYVIVLTQISFESGFKNPKVSAIFLEALFCLRGLTRDRNGSLKSTKRSLSEVMAKGAMAISTS